MHIIRNSLAMAIAAAAGMTFAAPAQAQAQPAAGTKIAGSYICVLNAREVTRADVRSEANRMANSVGGQVTRTYTRALRGFAANMSAQAADQMRRLNPSIAYCEQDQVVSIVQRGKPGGGGSTQPPQETPWGIARVKGGAAGTFKTAWVIDTGIDLNHPDLNVDVARSANFVARDSSPEDLNGHGSHVAGTIAAIDNAIGVIGVAPGATVVAVRVLDRRGSGTTSGVIAGIDYVAANGAAGDVANMSLGGGVSTALDQAVVNAAAGGIRFALAAGNESDDANNHSPARANGANVFTVSAFANGDNWASFSNFGNPPVDFAEPGVSIKSTWKDGGYNTISGTSMATPHLAGILLQRGTSAPLSGGTVNGDPDSNPDVIGVAR